jgi:quinol monooxygenase YgiN
MIHRVVKLSFDPQKVEAFLQLFDQTKSAIGGFEGCKGVKLLQDKNAPHVYFTYSLWESETALEQYRQSELFQRTWTQTKQWFSAKPEAWSLDEIAHS